MGHFKSLQERHLPKKSNWEHVSVEGISIQSLDELGSF
jgi:hypothetical protein